MNTFSGTWVTPQNDYCPDARDIAVQMGRISRYAGAVWNPLLCHSVLVARLAVLYTPQNPRGPDRGDLMTWAWALLHDAHEVVTGEIVSLWKTEQLRSLQEGLDRRLRRRFQIDAPAVRQGLIKEVDDLACRAEGIVLKLPEFRENYCTWKHLKEFPEPTFYDIELMAALKESDFYHAEASTNPNSRGVLAIEQTLSLLEVGEHEQAREEFLSSVKALIG